jgi:AraC family transcriptional regulator of adaptative response / DNA-3-methyladenine glycosylase II
LTLEYRPPLHWEALIAFLAARAAPGAEWAAEGRYASTVRIARPPSDGASLGHVTRATAATSDDVIGDIEVAMRPTPRSPSGGRRRDGTIEVRVSPSLVSALMPLLAAARPARLDANPDAIARHLVRAGVVSSAASFGGVRIPGTLDGFALAVRAILGQQVSVKGATTLMGRLVERFGAPYAGAHAQLTRLMPTAASIATCSTSDIASLGMPATRANAVRALAAAVESGSLSLTPGGDVDRTLRILTSLPGIGDWTAHYIAMRALRWPDAFPANDLVLRRAAGNLTAAQLVTRAEPWRPWRGNSWRTASPAPPPPDAGPDIMSNHDTVRFTPCRRPLVSCS